MRNCCYLTSNASETSQTQSEKLQLRNFPKIFKMIKRETRVGMGSGSDSASNSRSRSVILNLFR